MLRKFGGLILIGVLAFGGVVWRALDNSVSVEALAPGDCLQEPDAELITSVETVDCNEAHDYEVYAVIQLPDSPSTPYPGDESTFFSTLEACLPPFDSYVGIAYMDSIYDINTIYPTRESWEDEGDREAACLLAEYTYSGNIAPTTGSVRSTGV
ncbi:MAG: septum formation family protein [Acidimicrobiales bacterium]